MYNKNKWSYIKELTHYRAAKCIVCQVKIMLAIKRTFLMREFIYERDVIRKKLIRIFYKKTNEIFL